MSGAVLEMVGNGNSTVTLAGLHGSHAALHEFWFLRTIMMHRRDRVQVSPSSKQFEEYHLVLQLRQDSVGKLLKPWPVSTGYT